MPPPTLLPPQLEVPQWNGTATQEFVFFLGIDGGGSGCRARLCDRQGRTLGEGRAGPAATRFGIPVAWAALYQVARIALEQAAITPDRYAAVSVAVGLAGCERAGAVDALQHMAQTISDTLGVVNFGRIIFVSDAVTACLGAHDGAEGAVVAIGTGTVGVAYLEGCFLRLGGYGFPVSDDGSGAQMGLAAVQQAMRAYDGRCISSPLLDAILDGFHWSSAEVVAWMDRATASDYAGYAPAIVHHAQAGDIQARAILQAAAGQIAVFCRRFRQLDAPRIALLGGLAETLCGWLPDDIRQGMTTPLGDNVAGALRLAGLQVRST